MENKLNQALFNVIHNVSAIKKDTKGYGYMYATLTSVLEALKKPCQDNGIYFMQTPKTEFIQVIDTKQKVKINKNEEAVIDVRQAIALVSLTTEICHKDCNEVKSYVSSCMIEDATDPQKIGSAITYLRRYSLVSIFAMEQEDDDATSTKKSEVKKINNDSSYNEKKDVYEHPIDYSIAPIKSKHAGKKWVELNLNTLVNAYNYYKNKKEEQYISNIMQAIQSKCKDVNNNACAGDIIVYGDVNELYYIEIVEDIYNKKADNKISHLFKCLFNGMDCDINASQIYNSKIALYLNRDNREEDLRKKYTKRKEVEGILSPKQDTFVIDDSEQYEQPTISATEEEDPFADLSDNNPFD